MSQLIADLTDEAFEAQVLSAHQPVLVDFWATWCGPCKAMAPLLEEVAAEYAQHVRIVKIEVDRHGVAATRYGVRAIPTLMLFRDGTPRGSLVGMSSKEKLVTFLDAHLGRSIDHRPVSM